VASMTLRKIQSAFEALKYLYEFPLNDDYLRFRGQAVADWELVPSIFRFENFENYQTAVFEDNILNAMPPKPNPPLTHTIYQLEWLMLCQHYGVPTRLIDWSREILTALFFACESPEHDSEDGALFVCKQNEYPIFAAYDDHAMKTQNLAFVATNIVNPRMRAQTGCFMIWGYSPLGAVPNKKYSLEEYQNAQDKCFFLDKILIPAESKKNILKQLKEIYSISKNTVYLNNGFLEKNYTPGFKLLKEAARLKTLYMTDADSLLSDEQVRARSYFDNECKNMLRDTRSLTRTSE
jgi:hypothetical protein